MRRSDQFSVAGTLIWREHTRLSPKQCMLRALKTALKVPVATMNDRHIFNEFFRVLERILINWQVSLSFLNINIICIDRDSNKFRRRTLIMNASSGLYFLNIGINDAEIALGGLIVRL